MEINRVLTSNWLLRKPAEATAETLTTVISVAVAIVSWMVWNEIAHADRWLAASGEAVFTRHEYWRLWTSLFVHGDVGHLVSNAILFIPLSFFLTGYFGPYFFPVFGLLAGGLTNYIALTTMAPKTELVGISGVVYWMGAAWLTLYLLIGTHESVRRRLGKTLFIAAALFLPQTFEPHVSYISHFYGFVLGVPCALAYYGLKRRAFRTAEIYTTVVEGGDVGDGGLVDFDRIAGQDTNPMFR